MSRVTREINKISMTVISISGKLIFYALVIVLLITGAKSGYEFGHSIFDSPGMTAEPGTGKEVVLTGNESLLDVGNRLESAGLIRDANAFAIQAVCYEYKVKAGTFKLNTSMSSKEIINVLDEAADKEKEE